MKREAYGKEGASQVPRVVKNQPANAGNVRDPGSIPGSGRSPGEGNGNPLQYSCLENPMDRGAWWATIQRAAKSQTGLKGLSAREGRGSGNECALTRFLGWGLFTEQCVLTGGGQGTDCVSWGKCAPPLAPSPEGLWLGGQPEGHTRSHQELSPGGRWSASCPYGGGGSLPTS